MTRTRGTLRHFVVALIISAFVLTAMPSAVAATTSTEYETDAIAATNDWRGANELVTLKKSPCLDIYAAKWAKHIATEKKLVHRSTTSLRTILKRCKKSGIGENLASGYASGQATVDAWRASPGHNRNLLTSKFRWTAVGVYYKHGRWWVAQLLAS